VAIRRIDGLRLIAACSTALVLGGGVVALAEPSTAPIDAALVSVDPAVDAARARFEQTRTEREVIAGELARVRADAARETDAALRDSLLEDAAQLEQRKEALDTQEAERARDLARVQAAAPSDEPAPSSEAPAAITLAPSALVTDTAVEVDAQATTTVAGAPQLSAGVAGQLDAYLTTKGSPLTSRGTTFVAEAARVGLDPRLLVAISGAETSFGTYGPSQTIFNPFGMGPGIVYPSWEAAIAAAASNLAGPLYRGDGRVTIAAIQQRWAPAGALNDPTSLNLNWNTNVGMYYAELGGDPAGSVFTGVTASILSAPVTPSLAIVGPDAAQEALTLLGAVHPAEDPRGIDAAGLVHDVYGRLGVRVGDSLTEIASEGTPVAPADLRAGDVVLFSNPEGAVVHVGLYLGAGQFVHAPGPGETVGIGSMYDPLWASSYAGARRLSP
jgi:cell wall-associated NlpC family hydrolase